MPGATARLSWRRWARVALGLRPADSVLSKNRSLWSRLGNASEPRPKGAVGSIEHYITRSQTYSSSTMATPQGSRTNAEAAATGRVDSNSVPRAYEYTERCGADEKLK